MITRVRDQFGWGLRRGRDPVQMQHRLGVHPLWFRLLVPGGIGVELIRASLSGKLDSSAPP